jgi:hypothetical protein
VHNCGRLTMRQTRCDVGPGLHRTSTSPACCVLGSTGGR